MRTPVRTNPSIGFLAITGVDNEGSLSACALQMPFVLAPNFRDNTGTSDTHILEVPSSRSLEAQDLVFWSSPGVHNTTMPVGLCPLCKVLEFEIYPLLGHGFLFTVTPVFLFALSTGSFDTWVEASSENQAR
jgi:hypothetical protein